MTAPQYAPQPPNYGPPAQQPYAPPQQQAPVAQPQFYAPPAPPQDPNAQYFAQQQAPAQQPMPAAQAETGDFFGGAASISFNAANGYQRGTFRGGVVKSKVVANQTKIGTGELLTYADGAVRKQLIVTVQTTERSDATDDGERRLFLKGDMVRAARSAFKSAGAADIEIGSWLYMAWTNDKPAKQVGFSAQKLYEALYARPGQPDPMAGRPQPAPVAPPVQQAYQPPAPTQQQYQQAVAATGMDPNYATPAMQQAAYAAAQQPAPVAPPMQQAQDPQYVAWLAQQAQQPQAPAQPQYAPAPAAQQGPPADWNPFTG